MKILNKIVLLLVVAVMASCAPGYVSSKDIKYMQVRFEPLERTDFTLVGNLTASSVISGNLAGESKVLDKEFRTNQKKGLISKSETTETLYFAPKKGQTITGSLYDNSIFNSVYSPTVNANSRIGFGDLWFELRKFFLGKNAIVEEGTDPAMEFAYYEMVKKYPEIDYFINVRFDREIEVKGKKFTETIVVKADGIVLRVD